jgi:L-arabinokinase
VLPLAVSGREFLERYSGTTDLVTRVDPARTYAVHQPTLHPIGENARTSRFRELLQAEASESSLTEMGELMYASHASYSACGLGSDGTDLLVQLVRDAGPKCGLYGAKITGGGSGGTVAILGRSGAAASVKQIAERYSLMTGRPTYVFRGSSPGACQTDVVQMQF